MIQYFNLIGWDWAWVEKDLYVKIYKNEKLVADLPSRMVIWRKRISFVLAQCLQLPRHSSSTLSADARVRKNVSYRAGFFPPSHSLLSSQKILSERGYVETTKNACNFVWKNEFKSRLANKPLLKWIQRHGFADLYDSNSNVRQTSRQSKKSVS